MSLAVRLTLSFAGLILALGLAAFVGVRALTEDLTSALGESAASVSRSVVTVLRGEFSHLTSEDDGPDQKVADPLGSNPRVSDLDVQTVDIRGPAVAATREIRMVVNGHELSADEVAQRLRHRSHDPIVELLHGKDGETPKLLLRGLNSERSIELPRAGIDEALQRFQRQLGWGLLLLLGIGIGIAAGLARRLAQPLARLTQAAEAVGTGALGAQVDERGPPELRRSLAAFNRMSADLARLDREASTLRADRELAELGEIGRGLAHSLRNPLHALGLSLEALASSAPAANHVDALAKTGREQLARIDQTLRGFLALAAGVGAQTEAVRLAEVVDDVMLEASQRAQGRVHMQRIGDAPVINGVAVELRIILHALVVNALEASPEGGNVSIELHARGDATAAGHRGACIEIADEGAGIPAAIRARLFAPHVSSKPTGAGMGLYLAQRLAQLRYRGGIELLDRAPAGTCARLTLRDREPAAATPIDRRHEA
ncbi:MAG: ATP-binding protein [Pseudomarimonas sp.]